MAVGAGEELAVWVGAAEGAAEVVVGVAEEVFEP
jgi:hypothetical protein